MKNKLIVLGFCVLLLWTDNAYGFKYNYAVPVNIQNSRNADFGKIPLCFIENKGQFKDQYGVQRSDLDFKLGQKGLNVFIGKGSIQYQWLFIADQSQNPTLNGYRMDVHLSGANKNAKWSAEEQSEYTESYLSSSTELVARSYEKITYHDIYPNIDWVLYINNGYVEYDFIIKPGGEVADIKIRYSGHHSLTKNADGSITALTPTGSVTEKAPYSFQEDGTEVASQFLLDNNVLSFKTDAYHGVLTIDPVLNWATYYGGGGDEFGGYSVCTDQQGNVFMAGETNSIDNIATVGSHQLNFGGDPSGFLPASDAFLVKFNGDGVRQWATYYGGEGGDRGWSVACDAAGNVYLAGETNSDTGMATTGSHQDTWGGSLDAFLVKFNRDGVRQWGTYYGGSGWDVAYAVACDPRGNVYLTGKTSSATGIATSGSHQPTYSNVGQDDAFIAKFNTDGILQWGTYYGGNDGTETGNSIYCDDFGSVYIAGAASSTNAVASPNGFLTAFAGGSTDAFLAKFDTSGTRQWATYYGGTGYESGSGVSADPVGNVYLYGTTMGDNGISTPGSHQSAISGISGPFGYPNEAFLVRFDTAGNRIWGTYFGGPSSDISSGVACDKWGGVYITGQTRSATGIATTNGHQTGLNGDVSSYLAKFDSTGVQQWGTYFGGEAGSFIQDNGFSVAADNLGSVYLTGYTGSSTNIATPNSFQETYQGGSMMGGGGDAFLAKFTDCEQLAMPTLGTGNDTVCVGSVQVFTVDTVSGATSYTWKLPDGWSGTSDSNTIQVTVGDATGEQWIEVTANTDCSSSLPFSFSTFVIVLDNVEITVNERILGTNFNTYTSWQWYKDGVIIEGATDSTYTVTENGLYSVIVSNEFDCVDSAAYLVNNITHINQLDNIGSQIKLYPNPAANYVIIKSPVQVNISVFGIEGNLILKGQDSGLIDITDLANGLYLFKIHDEKGNLLKIEKLVKQD